MTAALDVIQSWTSSARDTKASIECKRLEYDEYMNLLKNWDLL